MSTMTLHTEDSVRSCAICGDPVVMDSTEVVNDAQCSNCGSLVWWLQGHIADHLGWKREQITLKSDLAELGMDSLATVDFVLELEDKYGIDISDDEAERMQTLADVARQIQVKRKLK